ncbi:M61 family metallopeptidase [Kamptonema sp. UHCC 0994]|uniref:M61 family metallopeptidase n=1 Tax=Kamptonema sp. UHCC 0994 TaxID=3031329 RepID=UPI0023BA043F|nr:M61 family metallopeptidase [Kamptonema sp. UHCC 0994]MDF0554692.1 M61 family metallopeptidase [Kamptonema sp. UHCC 0994]
MTDATISRPLPASGMPTPKQIVPGIQYWVAMSQPETHLFEVTLRVQAWHESILDLKIPVWTPGSYLVREYAKHLQNFRVYAEENRPLPWRKISKNHWQIDTENVSEVTVQYCIFANELTVRTNHLDSSHGYFNGAALFFYIPGFERNSYTVTIVPPKPSWQVTTTLPAISGQSNTFLAANFDILVDSPFEIGSHQLYEFEVRGKSHSLAIWGKGNLEPKRIIRDMQKIIEVEAELFGDLPYDRYLFLLHLSGSGFGGLEHKFSCSLNYPRFGFRRQEKYDRFMQLVAHEFFHLWNVKRIRPKALEVFDYDGENYTPSLWFSEGTTSYYDLAIPFRAGIYDIKGFFQSLAKEITRFQTTPGRHVQPLNESSWDAWIKLYRRDANSDNSQISYYLKGEMVSLLLDLLIRARHGNKRSLDDVMRIMWEKFGKGTANSPNQQQPHFNEIGTEIGFTSEQLQSVIESVAGIDLSDFFQRYLDSTEELPFNEYLEPFGIQLVGDDPTGSPHIGLTAGVEHGREMIKFVEAGGPAQLGGIDAGDELLAVDGFRVTAEHLSDRLKDYKPGDAIAVSVFHQDELRTCQVTLVKPRPNRYQIVTLEQPTPIQKQNFAGWLGVPLSKFVT